MTRYAGDKERLEARELGEIAGRATRQGWALTNPYRRCEDPNMLDVYQQPGKYDRARAEQNEWFEEWEHGHAWATRSAWKRALGRLACFFGLHDRYGYGECHWGGGERCTRCTFQRYQSSSWR